MEAKNFKDISKKLIVAKMFETYFNSKYKAEEEFLKSRDMRISCIGFYSLTLREFSEDVEKGYSLIKDGVLKKIFPASDLNKISHLLLRNYEPDVKVNNAFIDKVVKQRHDLE